MPKPTQSHPYYTFHRLTAVDERFRNAQFSLLAEKMLYLKLFHITRHRVPIKILYSIHGGVYQNSMLVIRTRLVLLFLLFVLLSYVIIYLKSSGTYLFLIFVA